MNETKVIEEDLFFEMVVDYIYDTTPTLGIFFTDIGDRHVYHVQYINYKEWTIIYECRDDIGVILSSIRWKHRVLGNQSGGTE